MSLLINEGLLANLVPSNWQTMKKGRWILSGDVIKFVENSNKIKTEKIEKVLSKINSNLTNFQISNQEEKKKLQELFNMVSIKAKGYLDKHSSGFIGSIYLAVSKFFWGDVNQIVEEIKTKINEKNTLLNSNPSNVLLKEESNLTQVDAPKNKTTVEKVVTAWHQTYANNYIAHAIWEDCVDEVIKDGYIACSEEIIRTKKSVSYEKGEMYGDRGNDNLPNLTPEEIKELDQLIDQYPKETPEPEIDEDGKTIFSKDKTFLGPWGSILEEINVSGGKIKLQEHIPYGANFQSIIDKFSEIANRYGCKTDLVAIAYDEAKPIEKKFDTQLYAIYKPYQFEFLNNPNRIMIKKIMDSFLHIRNALFHNLKLCSSIRTLKGSIYWSYGNVVVLKGNADNIISHYAQGECILKSPWENEGKFIRLNLNDEDCLVIGPKDILKKHKTSLTERNIKFQYLEKLTKEQIESFKVPLRLQQKN
jgi:hypothetical protein